MDALRFILGNARFLAAGVVLTFSSSYGQTFFISIFAARIMSDYSLTDGGWGVIYTAGTAASAALMFWAGTLTDRFRVRQLAWIVIPGLSLTCIAMALSTSAAGLVVIIFLLRFLGQGMMYQLATVSMARWFVARRGLALSITAMGFWLGQAALPLLFALLLGWFAWRDLWLAAAALVGCTFPVMLWLLAQERTPQSHAEEFHSVGMSGRHWRRHEVLKSPFFWMLMPMLLGPPAWGTALFFQQVHIAHEKGWPLVDYLALIPLMTLVSVGVTLVSGHLIDRWGSGRLVQLVLLPWTLGFLVLALATSLPVAAVAFALFGAAHGTQATAITAFWAEFFGTRHIGAIKATSTSIMVFGSAIGPGISGGLIDLGYDFPTQMYAISLYFILAGVLVWFAVASAARLLPAPSEINVDSA